MTKLFFSYSHADEAYRDTLEKHLTAMKHQGLIETWHDRRILVGDELDHSIDRHLEEADVILLLISSDFIASPYCYDVEMKRALQRHEEGSARVVSVILRHCDWKETPFSRLLVAPTDGRPVKSWPDIDEAFNDVVQQIKRAIKAASPPRAAAVPQRATSPEATRPTVASERQTIRSSNLRTRKAFSEADQERFLEDAFAFMQKFFENSLQELTDRNPGIEGRFRQIDANRFTAVIYDHGQAVSRCKVVLGGMLGRGISYSSRDTASDNSCNENLSVQHDDQNLYLTPMMGMRFRGGERDMKLTPEGGAEFYWSMLMDPLQ